MLRPITQELRKRVLENWLNGDSHRKNHSKTGVSLGSITKIISEERKKNPDIDELRRISVLIKKNNSTIKDTIRGANLIDKMNQLDITLNEVNRSLNLLEKYGENAEDVLSYAETLRQIEKAQGKTYKETINELNETIIRIRNLKDQITNYDQKKQELQKELTNIEQLTSIQRKLESHKISHTILDNIIEQQLSLEKLGFTPQTAKILADEMKKTGLTPDNSAIRITHLLNENASLVDKLLSLSYTEEQLKRSIPALQSIQGDLERTRQSLFKTIEQYDLIIKNNEKTQELQLNQIKKAKQRIEELKQEEEDLVTFLQIAETALINLEEKANKNRVLAVLIALLVEPKPPIDPTLLFTTMLKVNRGLVEHLFTNKEVLSTLNPQAFIDNLTRTSEDMAREINLAKKKSL